MAAAAAPAMDREKLHAALERLRDAVERLDTDDEAGKRRAVRLAEALEEKLEAPESEDRHERAANRLREAVEHFERSHPRLIEVLDQIARALSRGGI